jgi:hypothetical protein
MLGMLGMLGALMWGRLPTRLPLRCELPCERELSLEPLDPLWLEPLRPREVWLLPFEPEACDAPLLALERDCERERPVVRVPALFAREVVAAILITSITVFPGQKDGWVSSTRVPAGLRPKCVLSACSAVGGLAPALTVSVSAPARGGPSVTLCSQVLLLLLLRLAGRVGVGLIHQLITAHRQARGLNLNRELLEELLHGKALGNRVDSLAPQFGVTDGAHRRPEADADERGAHRTHELAQRPPAAPAPAP